MLPSSDLFTVDCFQLKRGFKKLERCLKRASSGGIVVKAFYTSEWNLDLQRVWICPGIRKERRKWQSLNKLFCKSPQIKRIILNKYFEFKFRASSIKLFTASSYHRHLWKIDWERQEIVVTVDTANIKTLHVELKEKEEYRLNIDIHGSNLLSDF